MILLSIPIYRTSSKKYYDSIISHHSRRYEKSGLKEYQSKLLKYNVNKDSVPWFPNQIIGYIQLSYNKIEDFIGFEFLLLNRERITRKFKGDIVYIGYFNGAYVNQCSQLTENEISNSICNCLSDIARRKEIKNRYIELERIFNLIQNINWKSYIQTQHNKLQ